MAANVPLERRVSPAKVFALRDEIRAEAKAAGDVTSGTNTVNWFVYLTGQQMHGGPWDKRLERAKQRGWIDRNHAEEFYALVEAHRASPAGQNRPSKRRTGTGRVSVPRLPSEPLRRAISAKHRETVADTKPRRGPMPADPALTLVEAETVTVYRADHLCVKHLGLHPSLVYGDDWWDAVAA